MATAVYDSVCRTPVTLDVRGEYLARMLRKRMNWSMPNSGEVNIRPDRGSSRVSTP